MWPVIVSHFVFFVFYLTITIRKYKENKIETKSIIFNSDKSTSVQELLEMGACNILIQNSKSQVCKMQ